MGGIVITFIIATTGMTLGITFGIIMDIIPADVIMVAIILAGNILGIGTILAGIMRVVSTRSLEAVADVRDFWVTHNPANAASAASCFYRT